MPLLQWKTEYSIGVMAVDQEHRELIELINVLYERMDARSSSAEIQTGLGDIQKAIAGHFQHEEQLMSAAEYDELEAHKFDHDLLLGELDQLMNGFARDPVQGSAYLQEKMSTWFTRHFEIHDARLHGELNI